MVLQNVAQCYFDTSGLTMGLDAGPVRSRWIFSAGNVRGGVRKNGAHNIFGGVRILRAVSVWQNFEPVQSVILRSSDRSLKGGDILKTWRVVSWMRNAWMVSSREWAFTSELDVAQGTPRQTRKLRASRYESRFSRLAERLAYCTVRRCRPLYSVEILFDEGYANSGSMQHYFDYPSGKAVPWFALFSSINGTVTNNVSYGLYSVSHIVQFGDVVFFIRLKYYLMKATPTRDRCSTISIIQAGTQFRGSPFSAAWMVQSQIMWVMDSAVSLIVYFRDVLCIRLKYYLMTATPTRDQCSTSSMRRGSPRGSCNDI